MALLTVQNITRTPVAPTYAAVAASDTFLPGALVFVHIKNGGGSNDVVTFSVATGDPNGYTIADTAIVANAGVERIVGPFHPQFFADPITGLCTVTHSFTTSVTVGVFNLSQP